MKRRILVALLGLSMLSGSAWAVPVGLELMLLVDVSGSVDDGEYLLQRTGYVNAFNDAGVQAQIASITGGVAVMYAEWSGTAQQEVEVGWTLLTDAASASAFAAAIATSTQNFEGQTAPGSAINWGVPLFNGNGYEGARRVIDISGDGRENTGANTLAAATAAQALGITVNGLAILGESGLQTWYQNNIVTPGGGTLWVASSFDTFEVAVRDKIGTEINPVPEPGTMLLLGSGIAGLALRRRRKAA